MAGAGLGGAFQMWGQERANRANIQAAQKQMEFQERMSSTAHTREVRDLRNAGLNPILSAGVGAASPSGASPNIRSITEGGAASAQSAVRLAADIKQITAVTENEKAKLHGIIANSITAESQAFSAKNRMNVEMEAPKRWGMADAILRRIGFGASPRGVSISGSGRRD